MFIKKTITTDTKNTTEYNRGRGIEEVSCL